MPCDLLETQEAACISGIGKISNPIELLQVIAQLSCERADSAETDAIVESFVERSGISDQAQIDAVTGLVQAARDNGWWDKCDLIYPFVGGTAGAHAQNLKSPSFTITWNGTVTHDANGITGNGTTGFGNTGYIPSSSGQMLLNSSHVSAYTRLPGAVGNQDMIGVNSFGPVTGIRTVAAATMRISINDTGPLGNLAFSLGLNVATRISSTTRTLHTGASSLSQAVTSTSRPTQNIYILALNNNGVAQLFSAANLAGMTAGSGITFAEYQLMAADWQTFQTALGRQV